MVLNRILRAGEGKIVRRLKAIAEHINTLEPDYVDLTDAELRAQTDVFRKRLADGETLDHVLPEAYAVVREAAKRTLGQRHFDVQLMGGAAMHMGNIAEMKTGEGKTLVSTLPAYLNALTGNGVHVVTVNDYLVKRDGEWMGRVHRFLGLEVDAILSQMRPDERRRAYAADITYGTNNEFGFDYLRDNMAWSNAELVQRGHNFAIVDEVDSILIDEARTPLIISGPAEQSARWYQEFARLSPMLKKDADYEVEEGKRTVAITESGVEKVEDQLGIENLYEAVNTPLVGYLNNALKAKELYKRDRDYIVANGEVLIVDEFTGRVLHGRRYNEGMHQAIEAKEGVPIKDENQTLATITLQNYFRLYDKLAGMTGTAQTEAAELHQIYKLGVVPIPTNMPMIRADQADVVYKSEDAKFAVGGRRHRRAGRGGPAGAGRHGERGEVRAAVLDAAAPGHPARGAQREAPREGGHDRRAGRPGGRGDGGHQHGRPRDRHRAGRQPGVPRRPAAARPGAVPVGDAAGVRGRLGARGRGRQGAGGEGARGGGRGRRPVRARHRAARVPPDRQPAARPVRTAGRPGRVPVLPLARRRPDEALQRRRRRDDHDPVEHAGGRADRVQDGLPRDQVRADPGRAAELRDPQERAEVRRGPQPAADGHLRRAAARAGGRRPAGAGRAHDP